MKLVARIIAGILFILFFGFALKNAHEVTLRFFFGNEWRSPLALLLLAFLALGGFLGVLAMTPIVFRKRRELAKCRKELEALQNERDAQLVARDQAPRPDVMAGT